MFFNKWFKKEEVFTIEQIKELLEEIKKFNSGAIDQHLSKHVDQCLKKWLENHKEI